MQPTEETEILNAEEIKALALKYGTAIRAPGVVWCSVCDEYSISLRWRDRILTR